MHVRVNKSRKNIAIAISHFFFYIYYFIIIDFKSSFKYFSLMNIYNIPFYYFHLILVILMKLVFEIIFLRKPNLLLFLMEVRLFLLVKIYQFLGVPKVNHLCL